MNSSFAHKSYVIFCSSVLFICTLSSAYLTAIFMYDFGTSLVLSLLFAAIGVSIDLTKTILPSLISSLTKISLFGQISLSSVSLTLLLLSFFASVSSLENGVALVKESSNLSQLIDTKTSFLKVELDGLNRLRDSQLKANHLTYAAETSKQISSKNSELLTLLDGKEHLADDSDKFAITHSNIVTKIIALSIELLSLVMAFCLHKLCGVPNANREVGEEGSGGEMLSKVIDPDFEMPVMSSPKSEAQILEDLKVSLLTNSCRPTHRSVRAKFKDRIPQRKVRGYLVELSKRGILVEKKGGMFQLAHLYAPIEKTLTVM